MKKVLAIFLSLFLLFSLAGCKDKAIVEEKELVIYSPNSAGLINATIPMFEETFGIKVKLVEGGTEELLDKIKNQEEPKADVMFGGSYANLVSYPELFEDYVAAHDDEMIDIYQNKVGFVTCYVLDGSVLLVNDVLGKEYDIKGYKDLLNPKLKGKIVGANPNTSSSAYAHLTNMLLAMGGYESEEAWDYIKEVLDNDIEIVSSSKDVYKQVLKGEKIVGLSYEDPSQVLVRDGADVHVVYMEEGVAFLPASACIVKGAKNLENAKLFMDFITSKQVQDVYGTTLTNRPVREGSATADFMIKMRDIKIIAEDTVYCTKNKDKILDHFNEIYNNSLSK